MRSRGFTLLELLVAMIIFTTIIAATWALLDSGRGVSARGMYEAARMQTARAALRAITADLRGTFSAATVYDTGLLGINGGTGELPLDTIAFVSLANHPSPATSDREMDLVKVTWFVDGDSRTDAVGLVRERRKRILETVTVLEPQLEEIAKDVVGLDLRYYDGGGWVDSWDSTLSGTMPKAVEVTIHVRGEFRGREETGTFTTRVWLPLAATAPRKEPQ